jgi:hypothetical protein
VKTALHAGGGLLAAALLPAGLRDRVAFRLGLPLARWATVLCVAAAVAGGIAWALGWLSWMERITDAAGDVAARRSTVPNRGALMFFGPLLAFSYLFTWTGASLGYLALTGLLRGGVWVVTREVPGDPTVGLCVAVVAGVRRLRARHRAGALLREPPPDLVRATGREGLEIVRAQARADLAPGAGVEVDGHFYEVVDVRPGLEGKRTVVVHTLRKLPPESVLRALVRYR